MHQILDNGQVMLQEKTEAYEQWKPIGMEKEVHVTETETKRTYQWMQFNLEFEQYEIDITNTTPIIIDGIEHTPIDGKVEIEL